VDEALRSSAIGATTEAPKEPKAVSWSGEGAVPSPQNFFWLLAVKIVSFGTFWVVYLQFCCFYRLYAIIMPVCVIDSDKPNE